MTFKQKISRLIPDSLYLKIFYKRRMGVKLDLKNPKTFNEKLQWLKLNNRKPEYTMMVDKYKVRDYIKEKIGEEYLIPLLGVRDDPDDIDFDELPQQFVLKCNHNSKIGLCICKDKSKLDIEKIKDDLRQGLKQNYYSLARERAYKNVQRKIVCEKYMVDSTSGDLPDYKFYCFDGYVDCVMVCLDRSTGNTKFYYFDKDRNFLSQYSPEKTVKKDFTLPKPYGLAEMFEIASILSKGIPTSRIDLYSVDHKIYFGEITLYSDGGCDRDISRATDEKWGKLIDLNKVMV